MTSTAVTDSIEEVASVPGEAPAPESETPASSDALTGVHRPTRGGELIPRTPLEGKLASIICTCALFSLATGTVMTIMGMLIHGLMGNYATKHGPVLWWGGLGPFILGVLGFYAASSRSRKYTYIWGVSSLLLAVTQTAIMGWVGNFTTSHYDVWPLHAWRNGRPVCVMRDRSCFCQDYYQGVYNRVILKDVTYIEEDGIRWRGTVYDSCSHLGVITSLFSAFHACWGIFVLSSFVSCIIAFAGSVCAKQDGSQFNQLKSEGDDDEEIAADAERFIEKRRAEGELTEYTENTETSNTTSEPATDEAVEVHSRF